MSNINQDDFIETKILISCSVVAAGLQPLDKNYVLDNDHHTKPSISKSFSDTINIKFDDVYIIKDTQVYFIAMASTWLHANANNSVNIIGECSWNFGKLLSITIEESESGGVNIFRTYIDKLISKLADCFYNRWKNLIKEIEAMKIFF
jgi:hypothetical protein